LIIGIDARKRDEPSRSDTVILLRFDLENKTYSTESIPRDTYIENGFDNKLGGVHAMGGPGLVIKRIREYFRTPIHHYMKLNFNGFEEMVDILGGIDINVTETINDTTYPAPDYGYMKVYIPEGQHHLTGAVALQYARSRHNAPLFARDCRQQSFIEAFAEQKVTLRNVLKAPALYLVLKSNFYTDMSGIQLLNLARLLHRSTLDKKMLHPSESRMIYNDAFKMDLSYQIPAKKPQEAC
jgi:LCP family protein required for cell wall assembly